MSYQTIKITKPSEEQNQKKKENEKISSKQLYRPILWSIETTHTKQNPNEVLSETNPSQQLIHDLLGFDYNSKAF